ncbi:hypothetical protein F2Q69_00049995 [Brassica cretica]|uniref:Uncharacterized protein n=1 Tax=Brassica cretica TaxID=69181 RepID=A0A8S9PLL4_BRACR|nr:hypothetical protein F2Q69_00049995 [Brassica cretica]
MVEQLIRLIVHPRSLLRPPLSFDVRSREVSREEEEAREQREMEYRPPKQAISSKVYDLDLNGFTESQLRKREIDRSFFVREEDSVIRLVSTAI